MLRNRRRGFSLFDPKIPKQKQVWRVALNVEGHAKPGLYQELQNSDNESKLYLASYLRGGGDFEVEWSSGSRHDSSTQGRSCSASGTRCVAAAAPAAFFSTSSLNPKLLKGFGVGIQALSPSRFEKPPVLRHYHGYPESPIPLIKEHALSGTRVRNMDKSFWAPWV